MGCDLARRLFTVKNTNVLPTLICPAETPHFPRWLVQIKTVLSPAAIKPLFVGELPWTPTLNLYYLSCKFCWLVSAPATCVMASVLTLCFVSSIVSTDDFPVSYILGQCSWKVFKWAVLFLSCCCHFSSPKSISLEYSPKPKQLALTCSTSVRSKLYIMCVD